MIGTALLLIGLQRDLLEAEGRLPIAERAVTNLLAGTNRAVRTAAAHDVPVIFVLNAFRRWDPGNLLRGGACIAGRPGATLDPRVARVEGETFDKRRSDAFSNRTLEPHLLAAGIARLVIGGVFTDTCVAATVRTARHRGFDVAILRDAVASRSERESARGLVECARLGTRLQTSAEFAEECHRASRR